MSSSFRHPQDFLSLFPHLQNSLLDEAPESNLTLGGREEAGRDLKGCVKVWNGFKWKE